LVLKSIGLNLAMHHDTTFRRVEISDEFYISFKLKEMIRKDSLSKEFLVQKGKQGWCVWHYL
jgi:hypothetical protein